MATWDVRNKRINDYDHAVFDLYRDDILSATIEIRGDAVGGIRVLLGALQPAGKERAWEAIRVYERVAKAKNAA